MEKILLVSWDDDPIWKKYEFVSWDDIIPNVWKNVPIHVPKHQNLRIHLLKKNNTLHQ